MDNQTSATGAEPIQLCLRWRKTWPDHDDDFVAKSPIKDVMIGRIMMTVGGPKNGQWQWTYQAAIKGLPWAGLEYSGFAATAREAAGVIEAMWFKAIRGTIYDTSADETEI